MRKLALAVVMMATLAHAQGPRKYHSGRLLQMESVQCVVFQSPHNQAPDVSQCQEYVLEGEQVLLHFRPKDDKHFALLPVGKTVEYRIEEGHFYVRPGSGDRKEYEYVVLSMEPREPNSRPVHTAMKGNHTQ